MKKAILSVVVIGLAAAGYCQQPAATSASPEAKPATKAEMRKAHRAEKLEKKAERLEQRSANLEQKSAEAKAAGHEKAAARLEHKAKKAEHKAAMAKKRAAKLENPAAAPAVAPAASSGN